MSQIQKAPPLPPEDSPFWVHSPMEIRQLFKTLIKRQERLTVWATPIESFVSMPLDISDKGALILDFGVDERLNRKALAGSNVIVTTTLDRVDIRFEVESLAQVKFDNAPAFSSKAPVKVHKLQRREYFRLATPVTKPVLCLLKMPANEETGERERTASAHVLDIGLGGLCLLEPEAGFKLASGVIFKECELGLGEFGQVSFDLEICHVFEVENRLGQRKRRAGCKFVKVTHAAEAAIQRYMTKLERDRRAIGS